MGFRITGGANCLTADMSPRTRLKGVLATGHVKDDFLLEQFIAAFGRYDDVLAEDVPAEILHSTTAIKDGLYKRAPAAVPKSHEALNEYYKRLPSRLPALYERLILSYRWLEVSLSEELRLIANPPGVSLSGFVDGITADAIVSHVPFPQRLVPFGRAGGSYDPVCFDFRQVMPADDCQVVRV